MIRGEWVLFDGHTVKVNEEDLTQSFKNSVVKFRKKLNLPTLEI
jgi:hypothetical protein